MLMHTSRNTVLDVQWIATCRLPTEFGVFALHAFEETLSGQEHIALTMGEITDGAPVLTRLHSECLTGDALFSQRCDCGSQLQTAMQKIAEKGRGIILYLRQEGRGIGLINKIKAYHLQDNGLDTVEANLHLGLPVDARNFTPIKGMLEHLNVHSIDLMTNNPEKIQFFQELGINIHQRIPLQISENKENQFYLETKAKKMGHLLSKQNPLK